MTNRQPIYLDYNATTPIKREVADSMAPYLYGYYGNPSSAHSYGHQTAHGVRRARTQLSYLLGCQPDEIIFTSGGTEANNHAIKGIAEAHRDKGNHIITSAIEHPAVLEPCRYLESHGYRLTVVPVDSEGRVDPADVERALTPKTILVSIMHANNEVGTIQPIRAIAEIVHARGALLHVDAAQTVGKIAVKIDVLNADLLSVAGHKFYAPKGIGALFVRNGIYLSPLIHGAGHEQGRRAGTENVLGIVGLGQAAAVAERTLPQIITHLRSLRDRLYDTLRYAFPPEIMRLNGSEQGRLPNTLSVSFRGVEADALLRRIGDHVAASAGAACHADSVTISDVLVAMDVPQDFAKGTVRFSVGVPTTTDEIDAAAPVIIRAVQTMLPE